MIENGGTPSFQTNNLDKNSIFIAYLISQVIRHEILHSRDVAIDYDDSSNLDILECVIGI
jgi:hypothetical protein